nr:hypothetical protein [Candidatus Sigynarchaeum springense]
MARKTIHTTLTEEAFALLEKYAALQDDRGHLVYGNHSKVIEHALNVLDKQHHPEKEDSQSIWNRTRSELNMLLVGKPTFLAYISGDHENALKQNIAVDIIEWYARKTIKQMDCGEIITCIKKIWMAANYFYNIDVETGDKGSYHVSFYHDLQEKRYSDYWSKYFAGLLERTCPCRVEIFSRNASFRLIISTIQE